MGLILTMGWGKINMALIIVSYPIYRTGTKGFYECIFKMKGNKKSQRENTGF